MISNSHKLFFIGIIIGGISILLFTPSVTNAACGDTGSGAVVPTGGNYTVSVSCAFFGTVNGVDDTGSAGTGNITVAAGVTLTVNASQTVVWAPGSSLTITATGSIAINASGQLKQTRLWMTDADGDGYPASTAQIAQDTMPTSGRRRNLMTTFTEPVTETFYPNADPESTSVDGITRHEVGNAGWTTIHDAAGNAVRDNLNNEDIVDILGGSTNFSRIERSFFLFDASSIPDTAVIDSATMSIFGSGKVDGHSMSPTYNIYLATPASNTGLVAGDYTQLGIVAQATAITHGSISTTGYNTWTLNSTGLGNISKTVITKFGVREATYDAPNVAPTFVGGGVSSGWGGYYAEEAGTSKDPKLVVTYQVGVDKNDADSLITF